MDLDELERQYEEKERKKEETALQRSPGKVTAGPETEEDWEAYYGMGMVRNFYGF